MTTPSALPQGRLLLAGGLVVGASLIGATAATAVAPSAVATDACTAAGPATVLVATPEVQAGGSVEFNGTGWCHPSDGGSRIAVKIDQGAYSRPDSSVHANRSIWAIVDADTTDGSFTAAFDLPDGTAATSSPAFPDGAHTLQLLTGSLRSGDEIRSVVSSEFTVGDADPDPDPVPDPDPAPDPDPDGTACAPTTQQARVSLATTSATFGDVLHVSGSGWCHPTSGGSRIGVKIDDGAISRLDSSVHVNQTIWAIVEAEADDGTFEADIELPDGTTSTSTPALAPGEHTLRFLTGSLLAGDTGRSVESGPFVIGRYRPNGPPDPIDPAQLRARNKHGVAVRRTGKKLVIRLPRAPVGDWIYVTFYAPDGSPRDVWTSWRRVDGRHRLKLSVRGTRLTGPGRVVVQSGEQGEVGALVGWDKVRLGRPSAGKDDTDDTDDTDGVADTGTTSGETVTTTTSSATTSEAGATTATSGSTPVAAPVAPDAPVASFADLDPADHGKLRGELIEGLLRLTVRDGEAGDLQYVTVYAPDLVAPVGWVTLDRQGAAEIDLGAWPAGYVGVTVQDEDGGLHGWVPVALSGDATAVPATTVPATTAVPLPAPAPVELTLVSAEPAWLSATDGLLLAAGSIVLASASMLSSRRKWSS